MQYLIKNGLVVWKMTKGAVKILKPCTLMVSESTEIQKSEKWFMVSKMTQGDFHGKFSQK